jgi:hypothetical protein
MEDNIRLIVSDETYDKTTAESVKPSSENLHTTESARSGLNQISGSSGEEQPEGRGYSSDFRDRRMLTVSRLAAMIVNWRDLGTPPGLIKSDTCRADRRRDPAPKHSCIKRPHPWHSRAGWRSRPQHQYQTPLLRRPVTRDRDHRKGRCPHDTIAMNVYARSGGPQCLTKIKSGSITSSDF